MAWAAVSVSAASENGLGGPLRGLHVSQRSQERRPRDSGTPAPPREAPSQTECAVQDSHDPTAAGFSSTWAPGWQPHRTGRAVRGRPECRWAPRPHRGEARPASSGSELVRHVETAGRGQTPHRWWPPAGSTAVSEGTVPHHERPLRPPHSGTHAPFEPHSIIFCCPQARLCSSVRVCPRSDIHTTSHPAPKSHPKCSQ